MRNTKSPGSIGFPRFRAIGKPFATAEAMLANILAMSNASEINEGPKTGANGLLL